MRFKFIQLSWFRGAADPVVLESDCKSMVVYGVNGAGKSSFVDAVEYLLKSGKIGHLSHEYSGKRQEKAVLNTHKPNARKAELWIKFKDETELKAQIAQDGTVIKIGAEAVAMHTWDYRRTILRQDEVAEFIRDTKGVKYSALLPLLGLHQLEVAAENLRQLAKTVEEQSKLKETKVKLEEVALKRKEIFGGDNADQIRTKIENLHGKYCGDKTLTKDLDSRCQELKTAIDTRIASSSAEQRLYVVLQDVAGLALKWQVGTVRAANAKLAEAIEPFINERLAVLQETGTFVDGLVDQEEVKCPSCGRLISVLMFKKHVDAEQERLQEIIGDYNAKKAAITTLCDTVQSMKTCLGKADVQSWRDERVKESLTDNFLYLDSIDTLMLRNSCGEVDLKKIEDMLLSIIDAAASAAINPPPAAQQLSVDKKLVETGDAVMASNAQAGVVERVEALISFLKSVEQGIREKIRQRSKTVLDEISEDIRTMWGILYPDKAIKDVHFYIPEDVHKAIDIGLKFYDIEQESPRLTLSEGYRNGLGLCIFLAMAKQEADRDCPLFLDDVVVSLDRNHRGMIAALLEKEFNKRQVVILTHDREWYTELRHQLDNNNWIFKALLPYETPKIGIRWSHKTTTFDDARAQLKERPDSAGNDARKIMDVELALIAERLRLKLPYLRADKNDKRTAHDFLERFIADGKKRFQKKNGDAYENYIDAVNSLENANCLLVSWANRGSHTFDLVHPEASKLIDACEEAYEFFKCSSCGKGVWFADAEGSEWVQCQCSQIRWRYGKG